jgi:DNA modification methylase
MSDHIYTGNGWELRQGDSCDELPTLAENSVDLSVYSPPFGGLFVYSPSDRDLGNSATMEQFFEHFGYITRELLRVTKPGRLTCCHIAQITSTKAHHGVIGLIDLRGAMVRAFCEAGWVYHGDICIDKDPQAQAIRTHSKALLFVQLRKDSSWLRPALADYILVFRKPGENVTPIAPDLTNEEWIEWARPIWYGIDETDTLNTAVAKEEADERHIAPLQLGTIERCLRLWSNRGELVLSPFAGIGSEGFQAVRLGRRYIGIELKQSYARTAARNLKVAESMLDQGSLFVANVD